MCEDKNIRLLREAAAGSREARDALVNENMGLVWSIVRRFAGRGYELEDLAQIGCIGLLKAIDKFDFRFEVRFSTYAVPIISGEVKRFLRDDGMIKVSRSLKEMAMKARHTEEKMSLELGREPTLKELSEKMGVVAEELAVALESGAEVESIYKTIYHSDGSDICLADKLEAEENFQEGLLNNLVLEQLLSELPEEWRELIVLRYYEGLTQTQVAMKLEISQVQVSRLEKKILKELRSRL